MAMSKKEYIEREAVRKFINSHLTEIAAKSGRAENPVIQGYALARDHAIDCVLETPAADVVEVVRCKDCTYCEEHHYEYEGEEPYIKLICKWSNYSHQPNDYCSYGERREEP